MLDLLRKRAQSWMTVAIFGVIILVFVFFFGYGDIGRQRNRSDIVANVNGEPILTGEFQLAVEQNMAVYRNLFKGEIPEQIAQGIRPSTLQQLINQRLLTSFAEHSGLQVTPEELAAKIRSLPYLQREGAFDLTYYTETFLPQMRRRYHMDFETMLHNELLVQRFQDLVRTSVMVSPLEARDAFDQERTQWTFETTEIDPAAFVTAKKIASVDQAAAIAAELQVAFSNANARDKLLKTYGLATKQIGPIPLNARTQLLGEGADEAAYQTAFRLTAATPIPPTPLHVGQRWIVMRLDKIDHPTGESWKKEATQFTERLRKEKEETRMQAWLTVLSAQAKIRHYLNLDES